MRPGQSYTVTCSISNGNTLSTSVKVGEATATPTPEARDVTAVGQFLHYVDPRCVVVENTMTLSFNTGGGAVTGQGHVEDSCPPL